jgi:hypothetical protein
LGRTLERSRLFEQEAERYDRCRPRYPDVVIERLLDPAPCGLEPGLREGLLDAVGATIDDDGGSFVLSLETVPLAAALVD